MSDMSNWYYKMKILTFRYLNEISGWNEVAVDNIHTNQKNNQLKINIQSHLKLLWQLHLSYIIQYFAKIGTLMPN